MDWTRLRPYDAKRIYYTNAKRADRDEWLAFLPYNPLRYTHPTVLYTLSLVFFILSQAAFWALSQIMCINTHSAVDGSFVSTLCSIISVVFFYYAWKVSERRRRCGVPSRICSRRKCRAS